MGFMLYNFHSLFEFFPYVFGGPITFLTATLFFFSFWEVRERQGTGSPLSPGSLAWEYPCAICGPVCGCLLFRDFLHEYAWSVGLCVCGWGGPSMLGSSVNVKCRQRCLAIFL